MIVERETEARQHTSQRQAFQPSYQLSGFLRPALCLELGLALNKYGLTDKRNRRHEMKTQLEFSYSTGNDSGF